MADMLSSSLLWRALLAIGGWFSALAHSSRIFAWLGRTWRASKTRAWLLRRLSASDAPTRESWSAKRFARLNARLAARHGLKDCLDDSILCRIWRFFVHYGQNSRLFSWLFSDGLHGVILFALSMYVVIDYVLRDLLAVPVLSSCWDECLMLLALGCVLMMIPAGSTLSGIGLVVCGLGCAPIYPNIIQDTPVNYGAENSQAAIGVQMAFAYVGSTFLPSIFGALAGVGGYEWMPYFAMGICAMMAVLFNIQKKIVETKVKTD